MDVQIQTYQKKAQTANEIVKYLNLELENYKDTYHLFAATQETPNHLNKTVTFGVEDSSKKKEKGSLNKYKDEYKSIIK